MAIIHRRLSQTGALALGAAVRLLFPHVEISRIGVDSQGFYCKWIDSSPFSPSFLPLLEQKMRELALSGPSFTLMDMVPSSAMELLLYHKLPLLAEQIAEELEMSSSIRSEIQIAKWKETFFPCQTTPLSLDRARYISLREFHQEKKEVLVRGVIFDSPDILKKFLKKKGRAKEKEEAFFLAEELELFYQTEKSSSLVYHPRGIRFYHLLREIITKEYERLGFVQVGLPSEEEAKNYFLQSQRTQFFSEEMAWAFFETQKEAEQASLLYIEAVAAFALSHGFVVEWVLAPSRHHRRQKSWEALLERENVSYHPGAELGWDVEPGKEIFLTLHLSDGCGDMKEAGWIALGEKWVKFSLCGKLETWMKNLLERYQGELPWTLLPEQAQVFSLCSEEELQPLLDLLTKWEIRFQKEEKNKSLAEKMHRALRLKVPYVIVFGKQEQKRGGVALRVRGSSIKQRVSLAELETVLREEKGSQKFEN